MVNFLKLEIIDSLDKILLTLCGRDSSGKPEACWPCVRTDLQRIARPAAQSILTFTAQKIIKILL